MLWLLAGLLGLMFAYWILRIIRDSTKLSDPMTETDSGQTASGYERNVLDKSIASRVTPPKRGKRFQGKKR
jgi:hypothetical protein